MGLVGVVSRVVEGGGGALVVVGIGCRGGRVRLYSSFDACRPHSGSIPLTSIVGGLLSEWNQGPQLPGKALFPVEWRGVHLLM